MKKLFWKWQKTSLEEKLSKAPMLHHNNAVMLRFNCSFNLITPCLKLEKGSKLIIFRSRFEFKHVKIRLTEQSREHGYPDNQ